MAGASENSGFYQAAQFAEKRAATYPTLVTAPEVVDATRESLDLPYSSTALLAMVTATNPTDTPLVEVAAMSQSPTEAKEIADSIADNIADYAIELERSGARNTSVTIQKAVPAREPTSPTSPSPSILGALGLLAGGAGGVLLALVLRSLPGRRGDPARTGDEGGAPEAGPAGSDGTRAGPAPPPPGGPSRPAVAPRRPRPTGGDRRRADDEPGPPRRARRDTGDDPGPPRATTVAAVRAPPGARPPPSAGPRCGWPRAARWPATEPGRPPGRDDDPRLAPPGALLVAFLATCAQVPWRPDALYAGGADPVVVAKAALTLTALGIGVLLVRSRPQRFPVPAAPFLWVSAYLGCSVLGAAADGRLVPTAVLAVRVDPRPAHRRGAREHLRRARRAPRVRRRLRDPRHRRRPLTTLALGTTGRLHGGLPPLHANELASLTVICLIWVVGRLFRGEDRPWSLLFIPACIAIIVLTQSRTSLIAGLTALVVLALFATRVRVAVAAAAVCVPAAAPRHRHAHPGRRAARHAGRGRRRAS